MELPERKNPCDQCRRRKVRCNYAIPCDRCTGYGLQCTREMARKKRGPKKGRGVVLQQLRSASHTPAVSHASPGEHGAEPEHQLYQHYRDLSGSTVQSPQEPGTLQRHNSAYSSHTHHEAQQGPSSAYHPSPHGGPAQTSQPFGSSGWAEPIPPDTHFDDSFFTFDEFTQNILTSAVTNIAEPQHGAHRPSLANLHDISSLLNHQTPQSAPAVSPFDINVNAPTPQTGFATIAGTVGHQPDFEVTDIIERSVDLFFTNLYPIYPVIDEAEVRRWLRDSYMPNRSERCLIWSICALCLAHVDSWPSLGAEQRALTARRLVRQVFELRLDIEDFSEAPTDADVLSSLFIGVTFFELKRRSTSRFHVREAITLASLAKWQHVTPPGTTTHEQLIRRKRAFGLLYITERGEAILHGSPVSIFTPPSMPNESLPGEDPAIASGLSSLFHLFALLDQKFVRLWNEQSYDAFADRGLADLSLLQEHLRQPISVIGVSDIQRADILITQQWMRLVFWQAGLRQGLISTTATDAAFSYTYPIDIAMTLCDIVKTLPPVAVQVHGLGIFEKQFEIAYSLMDTLTLSGTSQNEHQECLRYLLLSLSASPSSRQIYVKTLEKKMGGSPQKYRNLAGVQLLREDNGVRAHSRRQSPAVAEAAAAG